MIARVQPTRYERVLEASPSLKQSIQDAAGDRMDLRDEVALARSLLDQVLAVLARAHGLTGQLQANALALATTMLKDVASLIKEQAAIEAKRDDQRISVAQLMIVMGQLRNELHRELTQVGVPHAVEIVDACLTRTQGPLSLSEKDAAKLVAAPVSFDVKFRVIERTDDKVVKSSSAVGLEQLELDQPELAGKVKEVERLTAAIKEAEGRLLTGLVGPQGSADGNGRGNGHAGLPEARPPVGDDEDDDLGEEE